MDFLVNDQLSKAKIKVLNSALELFVEKGFFNTSIPDLVKHSGVSTGSIYHGFKDKQAIAEALMQTLLMQIEQQQNQILNQYASSWERFYQLCKWMMDTAETYPHVMEFILSARHKEFMPDSLPICSAKPFMILRDVIQQGIQQGDLKNMDVMVAAASSYGGVLRLIQLSLDGLLEQPLSYYLDDITKTCWQSIVTNERLRHEST
ncbi:MAG: TetR/AcrR family transcriptional regulator [Pseudomonadota bacterium]|nr:TetR/AcrR family transcriptional regulator [Pseudomonadota bacterium]